jgi:hypothetical protein
MARSLDSDGTLVGLQIPAIARLTATKGVEHGAIQDDTVVVDTHDPGFTLGEIGILTIEMFGHARGPGACIAGCHDSPRRAAGKRGRIQFLPEIGSDPFISD